MNPSISTAPRDHDEVDRNMANRGIATTANSRNADRRSIATDAARSFEAITIEAHGFD